jgi:hypothetical protein
MFSNCAKCGGMQFKLVEQSPQDSRFKVFFVQCSACNVPIGVMDYNNASVMLENIDKKILDIESNLSSRLNNIEYVLRQLANR